VPTIRLGKDAREAGVRGLAHGKAESNALSERSESKGIFPP
jgi:hypothetical protein